MKQAQNYSVKIKLNAKQEIVREEIFTNDAIKFICLYGGSRSGKTFFAWIWVVLRAVIYPGSYHLVFRRTRSSLLIGMISQTMPGLWSILQSINNNIHPYDAVVKGKKKFVKWNKSENVLTFFNGSKIFFYGAVATAGNEDSMTKILSSEYSTILVEEGNENEYKVIEKLLTRLTQRIYSADGKLCVPKFCTTLNPTTFDSWDYYVFQKHINPKSKEPLNADLYASAHFTPQDNLHNLSDDYIAILNSLSPRDRQRFLAGEYGETFEGEIFKQLNWIDVGDDWSIFERIIIYVDPSMKSGPKNDYKAVVTVGLTEGSFYVLDVNAAQTTTYGMFELIHNAQTYAETKLRGSKNRRCAAKTWIENQGLADDFQKSYAEYCTKHTCAIPYELDRTKKGDKFQRIETLLVPMNENYKLFFANYIKTKPINNQVSIQFLNFARTMPKDLHDDIPDAVHGAVSKLSQPISSTSIEDITIKNQHHGFN